MASCEESVLQQFYAGTSIFITGATGFMGKVLVEKLLRTCPQIVSVFLLVRAKRGREVTDRIDDLMSSTCFDRIKQEAPELRSKLIAVSGDIGLADLGMSDADRQTLKQQVGVVFHVAATVRFDEKLNHAIKLNVRGTRELLEMCKQFDKLKAVVHVSTAFANCPTRNIGEYIYKAPMSSDLAIKMAEKIDDSGVDKITPLLLAEWPNTYTFSKALGEEVVSNYTKCIPVGIVRPGVVTTSIIDPIPGWVDTWYGPNALIVATGLGVIRTLRIDMDKLSGIVPCDYSINCIIAAAWDIAQSRSSFTTSADMPVYNYVGNSSTKLTWGRYLENYLPLVATHPPSQSIWYPMLPYCTRNPMWTAILRFFLHMLPGILFDLCLRVAGKKPLLVKAYHKAHRFIDALAYFSLSEWIFQTDNVDAMWLKLNSVDQNLFNFDLQCVDWALHALNGSVVGRVQVLKDPLDTLPDARRWMMKLLWLHRAFLFIVYSTCGWVLWTCLTAFCPVLY